jgi:hypothetical protein
MLRRQRNRVAVWGRRASLMLTAALVWGAGAVAHAAGPAPVQYGTPGAAANVAVGALENVAATIRDVLGATALVAFLVAALTNHFVHDQHAKERAKEIMAAAIVGLLIAVFAPSVVNWIGSL